MALERTPMLMSRWMQAQSCASKLLPTATALSTYLTSTLSKTAFSTPLPHPQQDELQGQKAPASAHSFPSSAPAQQGTHTCLPHQKISSLSSLSQGTLTLSTPARGLMTNSSSSPFSPLTLQLQPQLQPQSWIQHQQRRELRFTPRSEMPWRYYLEQQFGGEERKVTNLMLIANLGCFLATQMSRQLFYNMAQVNRMVHAGEYYRLLTGSFVHGGVLHLLGNMLGLHWLGAAVEAQMGPKVFSAIYVASALGAGLVQFKFGMAAVAFGASGPVCGLFAAHVVHKLRNRHFVGWGQEDMTNLGQVVALNVVVAMIGGSSIGHWGHLGGALAGIATVLLVGPRYVWSGGHIVNKPILPIFRD